MKVLIAGSGKTAKEILRRLGESWSVTLIDISDDRLTLLKQQFKQVDKTVLGDASSLVTLKEAEFVDQDFVVAITNRDDVNLEICRLAREREIINVAALVNDSVNLTEFERLGVRTICWSYMAAREIELYLESPHLFLTTTGRGKGEIMEIGVSPYAPVVGRQIRDLRAANWLIASVYREGELIIPHADTVIRPNDRITIVGHTDLYAAIAHLFKYEEPSFPLAYGQNILAAIEDVKSFKMVLPEAYYLTKNTRAQKIILLVPKAQKEIIFKEVQEIGESIELEIREFQEKLKDEIVLTSYRESIGCVLIPPASPGILTRVFSQFIPISLAHKLASPLLIPRNTHPYKRILVPYNATQRSALALEISIDIAKLTGADISVVVVFEPDVIGGEVSKDWSEKALNHAREITQIYKFPIKEMKLEGNPVKEVVKLTRDFDLLVLGSTTQEVPFLKPHVGELLIEKSPCSVMVIAH